jgi:hypothetical protein
MLDGQETPRSLPASVALVFFGSFRARSRTEAGGLLRPKFALGIGIQPEANVF